MISVVEDAEINVFWRGTDPAFGLGDNTAALM